MFLHQENHETVKHTRNIVSIKHTWDPTYEIALRTLFFFINVYDSRFILLYVSIDFSMHNYIVFLDVKKHVDSTYIFIISL